MSKGYLSEKIKLQNKNSMILYGFAFEHIIYVYKTRGFKEDIQKCARGNGFYLYFVFSYSVTYICMST